MSNMQGNKPTNWASSLISKVFARKRSAKQKPLSVFGIPIKTVEWMPEGEAMFIYNGVDNIVRLDGTNKEARFNVKKPRIVTLTSAVKYPGTPPLFRKPTPYDDVGVDTITIKKRSK